MKQKNLQRPPEFISFLSQRDQKRRKSRRKRFFFFFFPVLWILSVSGTLKPGHQKGLAQAVTAKFATMSQITKRREHSKDFLPYRDNSDSQATYRYTASEAHLKEYLGDRYTPVSARTLHHDLEKNIENISNHVFRDPFFLKTLLEALLNERASDARNVVIYHASDGWTGFLYDVLTELRSIIAGHSYQNEVSFRLNDDAFKGINTVLDFQRDYVDPSSEKPNYQPGYMPRALSANFFLFGNMGDAGDSTVSYFHNSTSVSPRNIEIFFARLEESLGGLKLDSEKYIRLYTKIMKGNPEDDGRLYQIFVDSRYVDTLLYASATYGRPVKINYHRLKEILGGEAKRFPDIDRLKTFIPSCGEGMDKVLSLASPQTFPKNLLESLKYSPDIVAGGIFIPETTINKLQARLLAKPPCEDRKMTETFVYHRIEAASLNYQKFLKELRKALVEDISQWLAQHPPLATQAVAHNRVQAHHRFVYKNILGQDYKEQPLSPQKLSQEALLSQLLTLRSIEEPLSQPQREHLKQLLLHNNPQRVLCQPLPSLIEKGEGPSLLAYPEVQKALETFIKEDPKVFAPLLFSLNGKPLGISTGNAYRRQVASWLFFMTASHVSGEMLKKYFESIHESPLNYIIKGPILDIPISLEWNIFKIPGIMEIPYGGSTLEKKCLVASEKTGIPWPLSWAFQSPFPAKDRGDDYKYILDGWDLILKTAPGNPFFIDRIKNNLLTLLRPNQKVSLEERNAIVSFLEAHGIEKDFLDKIQIDNL